MNHNGERLREVMEQKGITEMALADRLGVHHKCITHYKGARKWRRDTLRKIAKALRVPQNRLTGV